MYNLKRARKYKKTTEDIVYTPKNIAELTLNLIKSYIKQTDKILEPCIWWSAFYDILKEEYKNIDWCEIEKWRDFFEYNKKVDWIITNPPYSIYEDFLYHSMKLANNIVFLVPLSKAFTSLRRIKNLYEWWGFKKIWILPYTWNQVWFPHWFPIWVLWMQKWFKDNWDIIYLEDN